MSWLKDLLCPHPHHDEGDATDAAIDRHIENQEVRLGLLGLTVDDNARAAAEILRRLQEDIPK